MAAKQTHN